MLSKDLSALELVDRIRNKTLSPTQAIRETLERIESFNPKINAFVALRAEEAMREAENLEKDIASGAELGPLAGLPIGVKDLEDVTGMVTSFGSIPFRTNVANQDSIQVARLRSCGAIVVGKTNTPEFGYTGFTKNRLFGVTRNPWNLERTPGGSSGGSAAAVSAGMVPVATGSDAGGSIRIPACYSGCFGIKPTIGRIPLGPQPMLHMTRSWTLGPLTRTVKDAALYLDCTSGYHPCDPDSLPDPGISYLKCVRKDLRPLKIGFSPDLGYATVQKDIAELVEKAAAAFEKIGHSVEIWPGKIPDVSNTWSELMDLEIYAQIGHLFDEIRPELGRTLADSLDKIRGRTLTDLVDRQKVRSRLNKVLEAFFYQFDLLLTPAMPTEAFGAKGPPPSDIEGQPIPLLGAVAFTYPFNISGHPAATVPIGLTSNGLPAGLQIIGPRYRDDLVLQAAYAYEMESPWNDQWPEL